ncbi:hypothetical protein GPECTOR_918g179 [Gonium pectorale]|uniref:ABC transporter family G domain-containing protein n=1 Tax=Gonium pectorale TaxID=33097 RepID=A0A150FTW1_GONPE|nr:hypothetical protein GPECTOR_918g179 [Gonium pectorale]|eukprot:KXZ41039.1 hypothetical protein GPECTOR_918g179 [Gonium pectorale]
MPDNEVTATSRWEDIKWAAMQLKWLITRNIHISTRHFRVSLLDTLYLVAAAAIVGQVQTHEHQVGVSPLATFLSLNLTELTWIVLAPAIYVAVYYCMVVPRGPIWAYYTVGCLVCWWSSGTAYALSLSPLPPLEYMQYVSYRYYEIIGAFYEYGICGMDKDLSRGDRLGILSALTGRQDKSSELSRRCAPYFAIACGVLTSLGVGARAIAFVQLLVRAHWHGLRAITEVFFAAKRAVSERFKGSDTSALYL